MTYNKNQRAIEYPLQFDMDEYSGRPEEGLGKFDLIGLITHEGTCIERGHYEAFTKRLDGNWWYCNDS